MTPLKMLGIVLIALGVLALVYQGFTYTEKTHDIDIGPLELKVKDKKRVNVPVWIGVAVTAAGAGLLLAAGRKD